MLVIQYNKISDLSALGPAC